MDFRLVRHLIVFYFECCPPVVLTRRGMRSSTNAYLTALAIADLVYLLCVFWLSLRHYPHVREDLSLSNFYAYTWPYSLWLTDAASEYTRMTFGLIRPDMTLPLLSNHIAFSFFFFKIICKSIILFVDDLNRDFLHQLESVSVASI